MAVRRTKFASGSGLRTQNLAVTDYKRLQKLVEADKFRIMQEVGEIILEETNAFYTPEDTGALKASGRVVVEETNKGVRVVVKFGGEDAPVFIDRNTPEGIVKYAVMVHEGTEKQPPNRYLQNGAWAARRKVDKHIINELKKINPR